MTGEESRLLWPWAPGIVIWNALWVGKRLFAAPLAISPEFARYGALEKSRFLLLSGRAAAVQDS